MFSFTKRKRLVELYPKVRRLGDLTAPIPDESFQGRTECRYDRTIPCLLCPWERDHPIVDKSAFAITNDLADRGVGVIVNWPFRAEEAVIGYWVSEETMSEPWYLLGAVVRNQPIGGGFWKLGIELSEFANDRYRKQLSPLWSLAADLLAPVEATTA